MVTEGDVTLGGGHTMQYTEPCIVKMCLEPYRILLINVTPINLTK